MIILFFFINELNQYSTTSLDAFTLLEFIGFVVECANCYFYPSHFWPLKSIGVEYLKCVDLADMKSIKIGYSKCLGGVHCRCYRWWTQKRPLIDTNLTAFKKNEYPIL